MWCVIRVYQVQIGVWLTQINSIIKIFCAICGICGICSDVKEALAEITEEIINLLNQINLSETHVVCDRVYQVQIGVWLTQINSSIKIFAPSAAPAAM